MQSAALAAPPWAARGVRRCGRFSGLVLSLVGWQLRACPPSPAPPARLGVPPQARGTRQFRGPSPRCVPEVAAPPLGPRLRDGSVGCRGGRGACRGCASTQQAPLCHCLPAELHREWEPQRAGSPGHLPWPGHACVEPASGLGAGRALVAQLCAPPASPGACLRERPAWWQRAGAAVAEEGPSLQGAGSGQHLAACGRLAVLEPLGVCPRGQRSARGREREPTRSMSIRWPGCALGSHAWILIAMFQLALDLPPCASLEPGPELRLLPRPSRPPRAWSLKSGQPARVPAPVWSARPPRAEHSHGQTPAARARRAHRPRDQEAAPGPQGALGGPPAAAEPSRALGSLASSTPAPGGAAASDQRALPRRGRRHVQGAAALPELRGGRPTTETEFIAWGPTGEEGALESSTFPGVHGPTTVSVLQTRTSTAATTAATTAAAATPQTKAGSEPLGPGSRLPPGAGTTEPPVSPSRDSGARPPRTLGETSAPWERPPQRLPPPGPPGIAAVDAWVLGELPVGPAQGGAQSLLEAAGGPGTRASVRRVWAPRPGVSGEPVSGDGQGTCRPPGRLLRERFVFFPGLRFPSSCAKTVPGRGRASRSCRPRAAGAGLPRSSARPGLARQLRCAGRGAWPPHCRAGRVRVLGAPRRAALSVAYLLPVPSSSRRAVRAGRAWAWPLRPPHQLPRVALTGRPGSQQSSALPSVGCEPLPGWTGLACCPPRTSLSTETWMRKQTPFIPNCICYC
ncbi:Adherens junction-associated protein 1 [Galemys pyrenaicus]|uniref:Adherens junction-associated protein 1 n=1 Tax=Galemys pyrenaicus TaxID=202257 RepID=A0A8J6DCT5_GALPY|nr:Adherens junction-associated protein 1 [Galemys pyrenaicus]